MPSPQNLAFRTVGRPHSFPFENGGRRRGPSFSDYGPVGARPMIFAHRSSGLLYPEETLEGYRLSLLNGTPSVEMDEHILSDGVPGPMHDDTVDRVTTSTGDVSSFSSAQFQALDMDPDVWLGGGPGGTWGTLHPPLASTVLAEFKGKALFVLENKTGSSIPMLDAVAAAGIRKDQILFGEFGTTAGGYAVSRGYLGFNSKTTDSTTELAATVAAGIQYVFLDDTLLDATVATWLAAGLKVWMFTTNRRSTRDAKVAIGVSGFFTDDVIYMSSYAPLYTQDTWANGMWMPGMLDYNFATGPTTRGRIFPGGWWGWEDTGSRHVLQGWAGPIKGQAAASDFSITFTLKHGAKTSATRWAAVFIANSTMGDGTFKDDGSSTENGYHLLVRCGNSTTPTNGSLDIYTTVTGVDTQLTTVSMPGTAVDEEVRYRVTITATNVILSRLDGSGNPTQTNSVANTLFRGGYFHFGHSGHAVQFKNVVIT